MADAACTALPTPVFFPADGAGVAVARLVCATCDVRDLCLEYALVRRIDHGVWGGASEEQRRRIRRSRRTAAAGTPLLALGPP